MKKHLYILFSVAIVVIAAAILATLFVFRGHLLREPRTDILARVGNEVLTLGDFYRLIPAEYAGQLTLTEKRNFLENWVNTQLLYLAAKREGLDKEHDVILRLKQLEREFLANTYIERHLETEEPTEDELRQYYEEHLREFSEERKVAQIVVPTEDEARAILDELHRGKSFTQLAREHSIHPSKKRGGVIGYIRRGDLAGMPQLEDAIFHLRSGEVSDIILASDGFHIVKVLAIRKLPKPIPYDDVKDMIRNRLYLEKSRAMLDSILNDLRSKITVETHPELLR